MKKVGADMAPGAPRVTLFEEVGGRTTIGGIPPKAHPTYVHCSLHLPPHHPSLKTGFKALKSPLRMGPLHQD